eukprot:10215815-Prorocentrum_lima.AAC.1
MEAGRADDSQCGYSGCSMIMEPPVLSIKAATWKLKRKSSLPTWTCTASRGVRSGFPKSLSSERKGLGPFGCGWCRAADQ